MFDLVFLYGFVFFFLFEMVVVVFCLGALLMMGLGMGFKRGRILCLKPRLKRGLRPNGLRGGPSGVHLWPRFTRGLISLH